MSEEERKRLEAIKHCTRPWTLSEEEFDIWEEYQLERLLRAAGY